ncbi:E3 ubiquitin-protein ligase At3g02290 [Ziziphus jujuba]|uniref:E3 ubiquitin-protein ligase At3g02290 n=1 Tax=Ziziphus jujuba TaxID=326968 RepID=A0A6P3ZDG9_ZIZJJ|nr:E3 ubiquitin-protein ligase At3g02290 [Ziziphus jujuba]
MAEMFNVVVSPSHALSSRELPFAFTGLLNVSLNIPDSSYSAASQLQTSLSSLYFNNYSLQHPQLCHLFVHDSLSRFGLPQTVTDRLASHVVDAALAQTGSFYLNAAVEPVVGLLPPVDGHDDGQNFQFIDDQLIIDQTTRRSSPSSSRSRTRTRTQRTRTQVVDRLQMTTHERVAAEDHIDGDNGELDGCCICLEEFTAGTEFLRFGCKHVYHQSCILKWLNNQNSCPLCRRPL